MKTAFVVRLRPLFLLWPLLIFGISLPGSAHGAFGDIFRPKFRTEPSNEVTGEPEKVFLLLACYCIVAGELIPIPCTFKYEVKGLAPGTGCNPEDPNGEGQCDNGGHTHNDTRPLVFTPPGKVEFDADTNAKELIVEGNTLATPPLPFAVVTHTVPQASGVLRITGFLTMPRIGRTRWFCVTDKCFDFNGMVMDGTVDVRVRNLRQLRDPTPTDFYRKVRGGPFGTGTDVVHRDFVAFAGSAATLATLPLIAENYFFLSFGRLLSVNDISLPKGGVFESSFLNPQWRSPHQTHREGNDVDINGFDPITNEPLGTCEDDHALRLAADQLLFPTKRATGELSAVYCEPDGQRHIDVRTTLVGN